MYIQLISIHGLIRGKDVEMGRDADTGGQVRYVLELAQTLSQLKGVDQVDLFTRRIRDKRVSSDYAEPIEELAANCRLVRLPCGGGRYLRKERLWPHLDEFVDELVSFTRGEGRTPSVVHGHYADAGYVAREVASTFDVPFIFTGHSLGHPKLDYLLQEGWSREQANQELTIEQRIDVEQDCLSAADLVVVSTKHERDEQYAKYHKEDDLRFEVIPPGTDLDRFFPYYDYDVPGVEHDERYKQARMRMTRDLGRFHFNQEKPLILALCRPDRRKNIGALIDVYGQSKELQAIANLAVFAGIRQDIESMPDNEQRVLTDMLLAMDRYDLYGKMAIPKNHSSEFDVPELYRIAASSRGIFANTAFIELFGLTAIEASATGLPFVATENGGPQDIVENCRSGRIVDVNDREALTSAMLELLTESDKWDEASSNGINLVRKHYTWNTHCTRYLECVKEIALQPAKVSSPAYAPAPGRRIAQLDSLLLTDIDNTLLGDDEALEQLKEVLKANRHRMGFGVASGRSPELIAEVLSQHGIDDLDVFIASVGSEIYYSADQKADKGYAAKLRSKWHPDRIQQALEPLDFVTLQTGPYTQREFKISYDLAEEADAEESLRAIRAALAAKKAPHTLIFSHGSFIDILPHTASKGKAVRYLAGKWNIPLERIATAGDSGNDRDMLQGATSGIVVGNYSQELESLRKSRGTRVYFAHGQYAAGILEGLAHYGLVEKSARAIA
ncbi:MAG: HAD-IIB family hydrolase [Planctomycetales bacterium]|nr:HAD-IIB family hydrolase [Planctomycetales bacterium]